MAAIRYTFTHKQYTEQHYLLTAVGLTPGGSSTVHIYTQTVHRTALSVNCSSVDTRWQQYGTHLHTNSTQNSKIDKLVLIYLLTAVRLTPGGSSTVHIYTQTVHRTAQLTN